MEPVRHVRPRCLAGCSLVLARAGTGAPHAMALTLATGMRRDHHRDAGLGRAHHIL